MNKNVRHDLSALTSGVASVGCTVAPCTSEVMPVKFSNVFLSDSRIELLKEALSQKREPTCSAFEACLKHADENLTREATVPREWYVPRFYDDAAGHREAKESLRGDANAAYTLALCFRLTGEEEYAVAAVRLINGWSAGIDSMSCKDDSMLSFSYHFPAFILGADLLCGQNVWPDEEQLVFVEFLRTKALTMSTMHKKNNWGNWGAVLCVSCAVYLEDEALFQECVERWKYFIAHQISQDGQLIEEVKRCEGQRGIWYSHFSLMPQTIVAEILRINGVDLFDYISPQGRSLKQAFDRIATWTREPITFPYWEGDPCGMLGTNYYSYFEILNSHWSNSAATELLGESRPMTADHSTPFLTLTHGTALEKFK